MSPLRIHPTRSLGWRGVFWVLSVVLVWVCVVGGLGSLGVTSAHAGIVHKFREYFGNEGTGDGQFVEPVGVGVDSVTHEIYVVDSGNSRVDEFSSTGSSVPVWIGSFNGEGRLTDPTQIAVDNSGSPLDPSAGDVYVIDADHDVVDKFSSNGGYEGNIAGICEKEKEAVPCKLVHFGKLSGVAVDPSGSVWVEEGKGNISNFTDAQENQYLSTRSTAFGGGLFPGLAVDLNDDIFLNTGEIVEVNSLGETLANPFGSAKEAFGVGLDSKLGELYADYLTSVGAFGLGGEEVEHFGEGDLTESVGVASDEGSGTVYVSDRSADRVALFEAIRLPTVVVDGLSGQTPHGVTLNGTVDPEGLPVTSCEFEYSLASEYEASKVFAHSVPCSPANLGSGFGAVAVGASLEDLVPESAYVYRLVASNNAGSSDSPRQEAFTGPLLGREFVSGVTSTSATLSETINSNGDDTHYYFEYGTSSSYGKDVPVAAPGADAGAGNSQISVSVHLQDLEAGTVYHYRFVAVQDGESFEAPAGGLSDQSFTTRTLTVGGSTLSDGRLWELVSPPNKKGALIEPLEQSDDIQAADDGSGVTYLTTGPHVGENPQGKITWSQVLSERGPSGWSSTDLTLPMELPEDGVSATELPPVSPEYRLFSSDLSKAAIEPQEFGTPPLAEGVKERTLYLRDNESGSFLPLVTPLDVSSGTRIEEESFEPSVEGGSSKFWEMHFLTATPDLGDVVFKTPLALTPEAIDTESVESNVAKGVTLEPQWNLYEWGGGKLGLVNVLPDGEATKGPTPPVVTLAGEINSGEGNAVGGAPRAVSDDGRRVAWTWGQPFGSTEANYRGLYVRDMVEERTVKVGGVKAEYDTMSSDGAQIFYTEAGDLYDFDFETGEQVDLTAGHGPGETSAGVQPTVSDVSEDGLYVYFVANGVLAEHAVHGNCVTRESPSNALCNLYMVHFGSGGWEVPVLVGVLSGGDEKSWFANAHGGAVDLSGVGSRVSSDGRFLAFMSDRSLTGYDNTDVVSGEPDEEVYLYDALSGGLSCVSCNPTGQRPVGVRDTREALLVDRKNAWVGRWLAGSLPGWDESVTSASYQPRYLSDGGRVFFDSPDSLVPQATNGVEDVYEFELPGMGGCSTASSSFSVVSGGCVGLISSGISADESVFLDASESGDDAFFVTSAKLSAADTDTSFDVYDAHVCSDGVPCIVVPEASPPCSSGDSCKAAPSPQPEIFGAPPTVTFNGAGNIVEEVKPKAKTKPKAKPKKKKKSKKKKVKKGKAKKSAARRSATKAGRVGGASRKGWG